MEGPFPKKKKGPPIFPPNSNKKKKFNLKTNLEKPKKKAGGGKFELKKKFLLKLDCFLKTLHFFGGGMFFGTNPKNPKKRKFFSVRKPFLKGVLWGFRVIFSLANFFFFRLGFWAWASLKEPQKGLKMGKAPR